VQIIQLNEEGRNLTQISTFEHQYPPTKLLWIPDKKGIKQDLLATSGEYLRIWSVDPTSSVVTMKAELKNVLGYDLFLDKTIRVFCSLDIF
jgi:WD repeat-containing protein 68